MKTKFTCEYCGRRISEEHCPYCGGLNSFDFETAEKNERREETVYRTETVMHNILEYIRRIWKFVLIATVVIIVLAVGTYIINDRYASRESSSEMSDLTEDIDTALSKNEYKYSDNIIDISDNPEFKMITLDGEELSVRLQCSFTDIDSACELNDVYYDRAADKDVNIRKHGKTIAPHREFAVEDMEGILRFALYNNTTQDKEYTECIVDEISAYRTTYEGKEKTGDIYYDGHRLTQSPQKLVEELGEPSYISKYSDGELVINYKSYHGDISLSYSDGILKWLTISHDKGSRIYD